VSWGRLGSGVAEPWPRARATLGAVAVTTAIAIAYELFRGSPIAVVPTLLLFYGGSAGIITAFAVWTSAASGLPSLLALSCLTGRQRLARWGLLGIGLGGALAAASVALSGGADSPLQPWFWRPIQTPLGAVLFSARAALLEETFFRLFLIPLLVSLAMRGRPVRYRLQLTGGNAQAVQDRAPVSGTVVLVATVLSSGLFGLAHPFNPVGAMMLAPTLAVAYLWGGWESAVTAHFTANLLLFSFFYP